MGRSSFFSDKSSNFPVGIGNLHVAYLLNELMSRHKKNHEKRRLVGATCALQESPQVVIVHFIVDVSV